ncbi:MAG: type II toxin-antitoxin system HicA family toxin [Armatimonadetes bacterium]|nr:type II toxin-antitoxin system HicA family toxin [Armatimonadota bacterium]
MQVREVLSRLRAEGWVEVRTRGSHRQFAHPSKPGKRVTGAGRSNEDVPPGTLGSIKRQAGWK